MSFSIHLVDVCWSAAETSPLFSELNLTFGTERTGLVGRNGSGKTTLLRLLAQDLLPVSGHVQVSGSVAMMRQDALEHPDHSLADLFGISNSLAVLRRAEAGRATMDDIAEADWTLPARMQAALMRCDLDIDPCTPLGTLSGGQRNRAALAALIFADPDFLLLDEPTNNLDAAGRAAVLDLVRGWSGGMIIVSHDRELLAEMDAIIELTSLGASRYGGNYSAYRQAKDVELAAARRAVVDAEKSRAETARRSQQAAERKARKDSAGARSRERRDQPKVVMDAAKARAEASGGAGARLRDARRDAAEEALAAARERIEILHPIEMENPSSGLQPGKTALRVDRVSFGYESNKPVVKDFSLELTGPERVVVAGPNGSGKSTLLKLISGLIRPSSGDIDLAVPFRMLDQHVAMLDASLSLKDNFLKLNPLSEPRLAHAALARFGFRASDAMQIASDLSGGERLRSALACALGAIPTPMLLILDEPTNHLDLEGIAALEAAIESYDGAVLAVSHDAAFRRSLSPNRVVQLPG